MAKTYDENGKVTSTITERKLAEARSVFETPEQKKRRENQKYLDNVDKVLRPKKA